MRGKMLLLRILCGSIDVLLVMLPVQLLMMGVMAVDATTASYFFLILLAVYSAVCEDSLGGATLGKYFGKLCVADRDGGRAPMLYLGLREMVKATYFLPRFGWIIAAASLIFYLLKGETLHDAAGRTRVITRWQRGREEEGRS